MPNTTVTVSDTDATQVTVTSVAPNATSIRSVAISATAPTAGQALVATSASAAAWADIATQAELNTHTSDIANPHAVTKAQVGLTSVEDIALSTWAGSANITTLGTIATGALPASLVTAGTFGAGAFTFPGALTATGNLTVNGTGPNIFSTQFNQTTGVGRTIFGATTGLVDGNVRGAIEVLAQNGSPRITLASWDSTGAAAGSNNSCALQVCAARGTPGTPLATVENDIIGRLAFDAHNGTEFRSASRLVCYQDPTTGSETPARMVWQLTDNTNPYNINAIQWHSTGYVGVNEDSNPNMGPGITINTGTGITSSKQVFCLKSPGVATGMSTSPAPDVQTDDFFTIGIGSITTGGAVLTALAEDAAQTVVMNFTCIGGTANTAKTTASRGLVEFSVLEHNGANSFANITADGNVFAVRAFVGGSTVTRMLVDEDGDLYTVTAGTTFDDHDDLALLNRYDIVRRGSLREQYSEWASEYEAELISLGILGGPVSEGGMTNMTQLSRLLVGALRQVGDRLAATETRLTAAETKLLGAVH